MAIKQRPDSPTNNFATINPLQSASTSNVTSDGNLRVSITSTSSIRGNFYVSSGKWYYEVYVNTLQNLYLGLASNGGNPNSFVGNQAFGVNNVGNIYQNNSGTGLKSISIAGSSTYGIYFDADAKLFWISKDGQWYSCNSSSVSSISKTDVENGLYGYDFSGLLGDSYTSHFGNSSVAGANISVNFGQDPTFGGTKTPSGGTNSDDSYPDKSETGIGGFFYDPPAGALALCTANLPEMTPTVYGDVPKNYFKAVTYTGDGNTNQSITSVGFQPDFLWIKNRDSTDWHNIVDSVRGATKRISSNNNTAEFDNAVNVHSFLVDGFKVGNDGNTNAPNEKYIAWCWKVGGAPTADNTATSGAMTANSVSLNGTLQSNYTPAGSPTIYPTRMSINTDAGFSIVKYQGASASNSKLPHGLTQAPEMIIIKNLDNTNGWVVGNDYLTNWGYALGLGLVNGEFTAAVSFDSTAPTNSVITLGNSSGANNSSYNYIAYCWHSVEGYSKFGSYTGNGSADGPFVYCGFRPAFVMVKRTDVGNGWEIHDNARDPHNPSDQYLMANESSYSFVTTSELDLLSNGFKIRTNVNSTNNSSGSYIFMAFAEQPFNYANAR